MAETTGHDGPDDATLDGFFDEAHAHDQPHDPPVEEADAPPWSEPPRDVLPGLVPLRCAVARSSDAVMLLSHLDVYPAGCMFVFSLIVRRSPRSDDQQWWDLHDQLFGHRRWGLRGSTDGRARFGLRYADGSKVVARDDAERTFLVQPSGPIFAIHDHGGSGDQSRVTLDQRLWLWPLPPAEPLDLIVAWPGVGIAATRLALDGTTIVAAAEASVALFSGD